MLANGRVLTAVLFLLLTLPSLAAATDLPLKPAAPARSSAPPAPANASPLTPPTDACLEWSDGCRTCQRPAGGDVTCSNVGIACVPKQSQCVRQ
jgi:hypothetical protein